MAAKNLRRIQDFELLVARMLAAHLPVTKNDPTGRSARPARFVVALIVASVCSFASGDEVDYQSQIKPILAIKCYSCHGALKQQSGLRLETRLLMIRGGESGNVIVPGSSHESSLVKRITASEEERMPPAHAGPPLTADEIGLIRRWIDQGAKAPQESIPVDPRDHWAYRPLVQPAVPGVGNSWVKNSLDAFVAKRHQQFGLTPQAEAPRGILFTATLP